ncbi:MAG TPA: hypothetical protein VND99_03105 [Candidatus Acidoferrales bacterium]|nr:hypothetical protein [Candidatus Acidoferrales bacterium]
MPKKRKTRKQKIHIDQKKQVVHEQAPSVAVSQKKKTPSTEQQSPMPGVTFSLSASNAPKQTASIISKPRSSAVAISTEEYGYLGIDLMKTAIVTGAIVITEIIIRILFRG